MNEGYLEENVKGLKFCNKMMAWAHVMYLKSKGQQGINALHVLIDLEKENLEKVKDSKGIEEIVLSEILMLQGLAMELREELDKLANGKENESWLHSK